VIDDFRVLADVPSTTLYGGITVRSSFCLSFPTPYSCPEGATLSPSTLIYTQTTTPMIANGRDRYDFTLKLRDRYGNKVTEGKIRVDYRDSVRTLQVDSTEYGGYSSDDCILPKCSIITT
jgi:hypothetical protein